MKVRVEVRRPHLVEHPAPGRSRRAVSERLRGVLVLANGTRIALPPSSLPFSDDEAIDAFVRRSAEKIRTVMSDEGVVENLCASLLQLARPFRLPPDALEEARAQQRETLDSVRRALRRPSGS